MSVKDLYNNNKPAASGSGLFLKTEDGNTYRLRILDVPVVFNSEYNGKITTKWAWPVYNHDEQKVQILQKGATVYNDINSLVQDDDWGDPSEYDIKLTHTGSGTDTKYNVSPSPKSQPVPADLEMPDVEAIIGASPSSSHVHKLGQKAPDDGIEISADGDEKPIDLSEIPF